ncbi:glycosyltransferase [Mucilaginibacter galii]
MPRFASMLADGMRARRHQVEEWTAEAVCYNKSFPASLRKWLGYIDQYIIFPFNVKKKIKRSSSDTLFVFTDQALGPWVPLLANRPHIIHCHDFLAQRSALGEFEENKTGASGQKYQAYIRKGYQKGKNFISVSKNTQQDLHRFLPQAPKLSEVVYNGLNQSFEITNSFEAKDYISKDISVDLAEGYLLHVGGNQWYKNRKGVIDIYNAWRDSFNQKLKLLMIGAPPNELLKQAQQSSIYANDIHFLTGKDDDFVRKAYAGATLFLFPSLAEGFGWPIAEAMVSGCPVVTTNAAPMTEVGGDAAFYINRKPFQSNKDWASDAALVVNQVLKTSLEERERIVKAGIANAGRFDTKKSLDQIENLYKHVLKGSE